MLTRFFYILFILVVQIVFYQEVHIEIFGLNMYGLNLSYLIFLLGFVVIGVVNFKLLDLWERIVLSYLMVILLFESIRLSGVFNISQGLFNSVITIIYFSFNYYLFRAKLKNDKKRSKLLNLLSSAFFVFLLFSTVLGQVQDKDAFPVMTISLFFIYLISISLLGLLSIIDLPVKQPLYKNSFFLFLLPTLVMYSLHFWTISLGHFINELKMETIYKHRFLMLDLSRMIMVMCYGLMSFMFFKSRKNITSSS